ncbi:flagellar export chaperone FliS [Desulfitibacter alkalitolerans]|uniref:flagellar export chaperone FliS n=1 Tax=Desulfitibacter alkalitolerans TaxID=264641 RepID=UPI00048A3492|nr:flagellar export chaperone FliS [Desulfitibacter alkalitolerans]
MNSPVNTYLQQQVSTVSQEKLVLMLYDGEIKFLKKALESIAAKNIQEAHYNILRAQDILMGLMSGLNMSTGQIAENLFNLYEYMHSRLVEANIYKDTSIIEEVLTMIIDLRNTWNQILKTTKVVNQ